MRDESHTFGSGSSLPRFRRLATAVSMVGLLNGCASPASLVQLSASRSDFDALVHGSKMEVQYDLVSSPGFAAEEIARRESVAGKAIMPACVRPYTERLGEKVQLALEHAKSINSLSGLDTLPAQAAVLDRDFDRCLKRFGVVGFNLVRTEDDKERRLPEYLTSVIASLRSLGAARSEFEAEKAATAQLALAAVLVVAAAGTVNPDQTYVRSYRRRDGTSVRGHTRTNPNGTCFDNLRGC